MLNRISLTAITLILSFLCVAPSSQAEDVQPIKAEMPKLGRPVDFDKDVKPILTANCLACHNKSDKESGFILETVAQMKKNGATEEQALVAGKPEESYLFKLAAHMEDPVMPPMPNDVGAKKLTPKQVGILKQWILEGAKEGTGTTAAITWQSPATQLNSVYSLALSQWSERLAVGRGNQLYVYEMSNLGQPTRLADPALAELKTANGTFPNHIAHLDFVNAIAIHPNGNLIASGGYRNVKLWERNTPNKAVEVTPGGEIRAIAVNHAGTQIAVLTSEKLIKLFAADGKPVGNPIPTDDDQVTSLTFSNDDQAIITGSKTKAVVVRQIADPTKPLQFASPNPVTKVLTRGENLIVTGHEDGKLRVWAWPTAETPTENPIRELPGHNNQAVTELKAVATSPNEIISGGNDGRARRWDVSNGRLIREYNHGNQITAIAISADGNRIATTSTNNQVAVWDLNGKKIGDVRGAIVSSQNVQQLTETLSVRKSQRGLADADVKAAEKSVKDRTESLKKSNEAKTAAAKELEDAKKKEQDEKKKLDDAKAKLAGKPDDKNLQKGVENAEKAYKTAADNLAAADRKLKSAERGIKLEEEALKLANEKVKTTQAALAEADRIQKEAEESVKQAQQAMNEHAKTFRDLEFIGNSYTLISGNDNGAVDLWDAETATPNHSMMNPGTPIQEIEPLANNRLLIQKDAQTLEVWNRGGEWSLKTVIGPKSSKPEDLPTSEFEDRITALDFSNDGKLLAIGGGTPSRSGQVHFWDVAGSKMKSSLTDPHSDSVTSVRFSLDDQQLLTAGTDKFAKIFDVASGNAVRSFEGHTEHVLAADWQADQSTIATAGADKAIKVWNARTGEQIRTISNYSKQVTALEFVGPGGNIISCGGDKGVKLHTASNGRNFRSFGGMDSYSFAATCNRDESLVVAGGQSGNVFIWNGKTGQLIRKLEPIAEPKKEVATNVGK